jgi:hypothetical protein
MQIPGRRVTRKRLIQTDHLIVAVDGDIAWLKAEGKVYQLVDAA